MENIHEIKRSSRRAGLLSIFGFIIILASLFYSYTQLSGLENTIQIKKDELEKQRKEIESLKIMASNYRDQINDYISQVEKYKDDIANLTSKANEIDLRVKDLDSTQQSLLDFLVSCKPCSYKPSDFNARWSSAQPFWTFTQTSSHTLLPKSFSMSCLALLDISFKRSPFLPIIMGL